MRFTRKCFIFVLLSFLLLTNFEFSNPGMTNGVELIRTRGTIVVNASGGGDFTKIQPAIDAANVGDTVYVEKGNYNEHIRIEKSINLIGVSSEEAQISWNTGWSVVDVSNDSVNISGFTIKSINNACNGIELWSVSNCTITDTICRNADIGINVEGDYFSGRKCNNIIISNNSLYNNICGIFINNSKNTRILSNTCLSNTDGIWLHNSINNVISDNKCRLNQGNGIILSSESGNYSGESINNVLRNNLCNSNSENGISLCRSNSNYLVNNTCSRNGYGIGIDNSQNNYLMGNVLKENGIKIRGNYIRQWNTHSIDSSNTVNDKPVCYWRNVTGETIPFGSGQIILVNCTNMTIENQELTNGSVGIVIGFSSRNVISNNTCSAIGSGFEHAGIQLWHSDNNTVCENTCSFNRGEYMGSGLQLYFSNSNDVFDNTCDSNKQYGISVQYSFNNSINNNTCSRNGEDGIYLSSSNNNTIDNNTCVSNARYGIFATYWSIRNAIYFNNIIDNNEGRPQASDTGLWNRWNHSGKGNHWSDLTEPDWDMDGIVDLEYTIDGTADAKDHFPLVAPLQEIVPIADAGPNIEIDQHETATFDDSASLYSALIVNSTWNFTYDDEEVVLYGSTVDFIFHTAGKYIVHLAVNCSMGNRSNDTLVVTVNDITPPVADAGNDLTIKLNDTVYFNASNSSDNVAITVYRWRLYYDDEEKSLYGQISPFTFDRLGIYYVTLDVLDAAGFSSSDSLNVTVIDVVPPTADAGDNYTILPGETVYFDGSKSSDNVRIVNYTWSFSYDGTIRIIFGEKTNFTFDIAGNYTVTLIVKDVFDLSDTDSILVRVVSYQNDFDTEKPHADAGGNITIYSNHSVRLNGSGSWDNRGIVSYMWIIENHGWNITLDEPITSYIFERPGIYNITLRVMDAAGNWDEDGISIIVTDRGDDDPVDDVDPDDVDPDDTDPDDTGDEESSGEEDSSILAWVGLTLFVLLVIAFVCVILIFRQRTAGIPVKPQENGSGNTDTPQENGPGNTDKPRENGSANPEKSQGNGSGNIEKPKSNEYERTEKKE